jgi:hypothetical protein
VIRATSAVDAAAAPLYAWTGPSQDDVLFAAVPAAAAAAMSVTVAVKDAKIMHQQHSNAQGASLVLMPHSSGSSSGSSSSSGGSSGSTGSSTHAVSVRSSHRHSTVHYAHNSSCGPRHATLFHNAVFINGILTPV